MKNFILSAILLLIYTGIFAQTDSNSTASPFFPESKDVGVVGNVSGLINAIQATNRTDLRSQSAVTLRYVYNDKLTFRLGLAPKVDRHSTLSTDSVGKDQVRFDSTATQSSISFRPGVEYHLRGTKRLDPYMAADLEFGIVGGLKIGSSTNVTDTTGTSSLTRTITEDGGFSFGAKLSLGMNYFVTKKLFVGAEYGLGFYSIATGGDRQEVAQFEPVSGSAQTDRILSSTRVTNSSMFVDPMIQLTIGYFFSTK